MVATLAETLGWMGDLFAQHLYRDLVPVAMRRRWSFDGDGFVIVDDSVNELASVSLVEAGAGESGTVPSPTVANTILRSTDGSTVAWGTLVNAMVDAAAAIAGTKVSPDFGSQNVITTGHIRLGTTPAGTGTIRLPSTGSVYGRVDVTDTIIADWTAAGLTLGASGWTAGVDIVGPDNAQGIHLIVANDSIRIAQDDFKVSIAGNVRVSHNGATFLVSNAAADEIELAADEFNVVVQGITTIHTTGLAVDIAIDNGEAIHLDTDHINFDISAVETYNFLPTEQSRHYPSVGLHEVTAFFTQQLAGGAAESNVYTFNPGVADAEVFIEIFATAREASGTDRAMYHRKAGFKVTGGVCTQVGATQDAFTVENDAAWNMTIDTSGGVIRIRALPDATNATTFEGSAHIVYHA